MNHSELPIEVKRSLAGRLGSYFNRLNFRKEPMPENKFKLYRNLVEYLNRTSEYADKNYRYRDWWQKEVDHWVNTYEGRVWLSKQCDKWWYKWYPLKDEDGLSLSYNKNYGWKKRWNK